MLQKTRKHEKIRGKSGPIHKSRLERQCSKWQISSTLRISPLPIGAVCSSHLLSFFSRAISLPVHSNPISLTTQHKLIVFSVDISVKQAHYYHFILKKISKNSDFCIIFYSFARISRSVKVRVNDAA